MTSYSNTLLLVLTSITTILSVYAFTAVVPSKYIISSSSTARTKPSILLHNKNIIIHDGEDSRCDEEEKTVISRSDFFMKSMTTSLALASGFSFLPYTNHPALADDGTAGSGGRPETLDIDNFLRAGTEAFPMGVSSQAGKSKPVTGVFLRDGTEPSRDSRTGDVLSEIVLGDKTDLNAVLVSFKSSWPLAKGTVFDVECRDAKTGDGVFLSVTDHIASSNKDIAQIPSSFFLDNLFAPTGRFSFYGSPTNVKVKSSETVNGRRIIQFSFANLSQSTNAEIPRTAIMVASIPEGLDQAVMLVGSSTTNRWKNKGVEGTVRSTIDSFNASLAPKTSMKVRAKQPDYSL